MATYPLGGTVTVATAGTQVAFPSKRGKCLWIKVRAKEGNTGIVYLGGADVSASDGFPLHEGTDGVHSSIEVNFNLKGGAIDLSDLWLDAASPGDKADFFAVMEA